MLASLGAQQMMAWQAFYQVEAEDELQAHASAQAQAGVAQGSPRVHRGFGR
jgi:hypothetical protein